MTDFIHEHPAGDETSVVSPSPSDGSAEAPLDEKTGQKRVYGYIFILFIVAFSLLLWAFLMNQRSTDQVLSELRGNTSNLQSALDRAAALDQQNETLRSERDALEEENEALREQLEKAQEYAEKLEETNWELAYTQYALNYLAQLERAVAEGNDEWTETFIERLESESDTPRPLRDYLPDRVLHTDPDGNDAPSPAARYQQLKKELTNN